MSDITVAKTAIIDRHYKEGTGMARDYVSVSEQILEGVGGAGNISTAAHCMTRLRLVLKELRCEEGSGLKVKEMSFGAVYGKSRQTAGEATAHSVVLSNFLLRLPDSKVLIPRLSVRLSTDTLNKLEKGSLSAEGDIDVPYLDPQDLKSLLPADMWQLPSVSMNASLAGTDKEADATITLHSTDTDDLALSASVSATDVLASPKADVLLSKLAAIQ